MRLGQEGIHWPPQDPIGTGPEKEGEEERTAGHGGTQTESGRSDPEVTLRLHSRQLRGMFCRGKR